MFLDQVSISIRKLLDPDTAQPNPVEYYKALSPTTTILYSTPKQFIIKVIETNSLWSSIGDNQIKFSG